MSLSVYDNLSQEKHSVSNGAPLSGFDRDVLRVRGIDPDGSVARARGYRTVSAEQARSYGFGSNSRPGLLIPIYNLAGEIDGYMLRPHEPVVDSKTGKERKYLFPFGKTPPPGGTPAGTPETEEWTHKLREDLDTPVIVTESMIKGDSVLSHADRDVFTISIHGTWNWVDDGAPSPTLRNVKWRRKQGERVIQRRVVVLVPDSDYAIKPEVAFAWWTFGSILRDKNADVRIFHLPTAADGSKLGPDDALATGVVTVEQMLTEAVPLGEIPEHALAAPTNSDKERIAQLEAKLARANALISAQARLLKSPDLKDKQRALGYSALTMAAHKASRGEVDEEGRVELSAAEISNDWRPKPPAGEPTPETNQDGSRPLARRETVKRTIQELSDAGALDVVMMPTVRTHTNGDRYPDTAILVRPDDLPGALINLANYRREKTRKPYTRQEPCSHCGEVHSRTRVDYCDGCGGETARKHIPVPDADRPVDELEPDKLDTLKHSTSASGKFAEAENDDVTDLPAPLTNCPENLRRQDTNTSSGKFAEALCGHREFIDGHWYTCTNPRVGGRFYCDDHAQPIEGVAS